MQPKSVKFFKSNKHKTHESKSKVMSFWTILGVIAAIVVTLVIFPLVFGFFIDEADKYINNF